MLWAALRGRFEMVEGLSTGQGWCLLSPSLPLPVMRNYAACDAYCWLMIWARTCLFWIEHMLPILELSTCLLGQPILNWAHPAYFWMSTCCLFLLLTVGLLSGCDALTDALPKFCCPPLVVMPSLNLDVLLYSYNNYYSHNNYYSSVLLQQLLILYTTYYNYYILLTTTLLLLLLYWCVGCCSYFWLLLYYSILLLLLPNYCCLYTSYILLLLLYTTTPTTTLW